MPSSSSLLWLRRDLRCDDNSALNHALEKCQRVWCAFVFDTEILDALADRSDRRVEFILHSVAQLEARLRALGGGLLVLHGRARELIPQLAQRLRVDAVHVNRDYEPAAVARDDDVAARLARIGIAFEAHKDQVVFERDELLTGAGKPYTVFTPYKNAWLRRVQDQGGAPLRVCAPLASLARHAALAPVDPELARAHAVPTLQQIGFEPTGLAALGVHGGSDAAQALFANFRQRIGEYDRARDFPAVRGPSYLSVHLRFGTIGIRELAHHAWQLHAADPAQARGALVWLSELIWRDFYFQILHHHPRVAGGSFKPQFDAIRWRDDAPGLQAWKDGRTGYPLVDAAMKQINSSGYMHNRLRMLTASFLTKDLGIDWRLGERYFADKLIDFDLSANNGGWQWSASTGCDAQPWFRIFNPVTQSQRFDPQGKFIRRYLPVLAGLPDKLIHEPWKATAAQLAAAGVRLGENYPAPIVDHAQARAQTLQRYAAAGGG